MWVRNPIYNFVCSHKHAQLRQEKVHLEQTLEQEQEQQISKMQRKIEKLEKETLAKQSTLEQVGVCVCVCVCVCLCNLLLCRCTCMRVCVWGACVCVCERERESVCVCVCVHVCACVISSLPSSQLRREKIDLENTLEQEQEMLVNKLWKRMDKVEQEKRYASDSPVGPCLTQATAGSRW